MRALDTTYRGYEFRSRHEARWAVFFDALGVTWEYEAEGYEMPDGTRYLPDFHFPAGLLEPRVRWAEVKPSIPSTEDQPECATKAVELASQGEGAVVLLDGVPACRAYRVYDVSDEGNVFVWWNAMLYGKARGENRWYFCIGPELEPAAPNQELDSKLFEPRYVRAVKAALRARFAQEAPMD